MRMLLIQIFILQLVFASDEPAKIEPSEDLIVTDEKVLINKKLDNILLIVQQLWGERFRKKYSLEKSKSKRKKKTKKVSKAEDEKKKKEERRKENGVPKKQK